MSERDPLDVQIGDILNKQARHGLAWIAGASVTALILTMVACAWYLGDRLADVRAAVRELTGVTALQRR